MNLFLGQQAGKQQLCININNWRWNLEEKKR